MNEIIISTLISAREQQASRLLAFRVFIMGILFRHTVGMAEFQNRLDPYPRFQAP